MKKEIRFRPIGIIRTRLKKVARMPFRPRGARRRRGVIEVFPEYREGLKDLSGFSHVVVLFHFDKAKKAKLLVTPPFDAEEHGVFATRSPSRPNGIGLSVVRLLSIKDGLLKVEGIDALDGTPLLDIKPFIPVLDTVKSVRTGWLKAARRRLERAGTDDHSARRKRG